MADGRAEPRRPDHVGLAPLASELSGPLPATTDIAVIGGGLAGCALAYYLSCEGVEVVVLERGQLNREASGTNAGSFHFQIAIHQLSGAGIEADAPRLAEEVRQYVAAAELWADLERELDADLGVHVTGGLMVAETAEQFELLVAKGRIEREAGLSTEVLSGSELANFAPCLAQDLAGATYCAAEGHANPLATAPAFAARAVGHGAVIRTRSPVQSVELDGGGRFVLDTPMGAIRASRVVNASAAWADEVAQLSGVGLAVRREQLHLNVTEPRPQVLTSMVQHIGRRLTLKQATNGTFIIGGGWPAREEFSNRRSSIRWSSVAGNAAVALRVMPSLGDVRVVHMWSGAIAFTGDQLPLVGELESLPRYFVLVASTGFTLGPLLARQLAEELSAGRPGAVPTMFRPDRMSLASSLRGRGQTTTQLEHDSTLKDERGGGDGST